MNEITRKRDTGESGNGGQFGRHARMEAQLQLREPVTRDSIDSWLQAMHLTLPNEAVEEMMARVDASPSDSALQRADIYREVHFDHFGFNYEDAEVARRVIRGISDQIGADTANSVLSVLNGSISGVHPSAVPPVPEAQDSEVLDTVVVEGTTFHRSRDGVYPSEPYAVRIQANRSLNQAEQETLQAITDYALASTVRGETLGRPLTDTSRSFVIQHDSTKGNSERFGKFEDILEELAYEGSPVRVTDRKGPAGTRAVEGLADSGLRFEIYYDSVVGA